VVALAPLPFNPVKDFAPITLISEDPNVIVSTSVFCFPRPTLPRRFSLMQKLIQVHQGQEHPGHRHDQHQAVAGFA
jgi:hypothetical protein